MRIPPLYRKPSWQRFLAGAIVGGCLSWLIFLFMFGTIHERQAKTLEKQEQTIQDLQQEKQIWQEAYQKLNRKNSKLLTIENIEVKIKNFERYDIKDSQSIFEAEEEIKKDLSPLIAKNLNSAYQNKDLVIKMLENKTIKINNRRYTFVVRNILFYTTITINLELKLDD
ncbi:sporulation membrane protein YtrI [Heyndrickxia ginsengihumi]|uniref:Sporulation protein n=1 Tax=Heyndrickxia ginsengihumi TaxID=363870 RepID=A0A0A6VAW9_9BACI|nr:sporulation membrane protein YtrI [Heyndrickxia ginsengihumi]KHD84648.1 sporulation protein [Heyndrickxia ginsengihumi]MBE6182672.1 sporulation protein [Bacillus sp. (in: firmicutes)]MCM3022015.1 sporulation protein [Heyndrickxia ginsengihumi]NEY21100.1 sporulation protein [Heyndrickxia ginsengihumi]